ncbi:MAG: cyclic beta 1-2 glucan synthetase [Rubrivivax sp.]|nr:cyclic beta 1-2 glucan synthetase [Rubrivivax sp.]
MPFQLPFFQAGVRNTRWWGWAWPGAARQTRAEDEPLRAELFSADQLAAHGARLAQTHVLSDGPLPDRLLARLAANERVLVDFGLQLTTTADADHRLTPAAEWLLDNFYLIEEEIRTARRHLPRGYSRKLPRLALDPVNGIGAGLPRVYDLALQAVAHGDGQLGRGPLSRYVAAYQSDQPLLLGELWAIPIMLRLALIENLRRVAARVAIAHVQRETAGNWADNLITVAETAPSELILVIADMVRSKPSLTNAFVAEFARRLQRQGAALALPLAWMAQRLGESGETIEQLVQAEAQQQAANQVSVSNSIGSLRLLNGLDWREFVRSLSSVEQTLAHDPSGVYVRMDFGTRDRYCHAVEEMARQGTLSETDVARQAVALAATAAAQAPQDSRRSHVGFHLIGRGRAALEKAAGVRHGFKRALRLKTGARPLPAYAGAIVLTTLAGAAGPLLAVRLQTQWPWWAELAFGLVLLLAASQLAVSFVNWLASALVQPRALPRMDYTRGIAPHACTLVVVPTMLGSAAGVEALIEALEVRFLGNRDPHLHFGLLTDFHDAAQEHLPADAALVEQAAAGIAALNAKYRLDHGGTPTDAFFLFHRPRRWNARERVWMGYERKRGKLGDLNALLRGTADPAAQARFARLVGNTQALAGVRYVITLDTDTQLPRDSARLLVATMAHPLNRPRFGSGLRQGIVVDGYGILQPRVGPSLPSTTRSGYARLYGGEPGIDPYTRAVSDVYQDLFAEGSFIGKGIYDVDAFEGALAGRLPENRILSHDLLEGCYARSGLISDVQLLEDAPMRYSDDVARRYRWLRGDWQLLGWLRPRLRMLPGAPRNPLSALSRAKIMDNLRRSLVPAALVVVLLVGWALLPDPGLWTLFALAIVALVPLLSQGVDEVRRRLLRLGLEQHSAAAPTRRDALKLPMQLLHTLACLPHEAAYSVAAIGRTSWRVLLSKRRLLEWRPSADVSKLTLPGTLLDLLHNVRTMAIGPLLAVACTAGLLWTRPTALPAALPLLLLWLSSPVLVWWIDRPLQRKRPKVTPAQRVFLRRLARRTWAFFDAHVVARDNHLPPDNVQEHPVARVAHRTSPTNMGFALLAGLTARHFGYITGGQLLVRLEAALSSMERLERHRGHFFNWYDTQSLQPLRPRYVSTVDSGNLAGHLLTLRAGLLVLADEPVLTSHWLTGVQDSFGVLVESCEASARGERGKDGGRDGGRDGARDGEWPAVLAPFGRLLADCSDSAPVNVQDWRTLLEALDGAAAVIFTALSQPAASTAALADADANQADVDADRAAYAECLYWAQQLAEHCRAGVDELQVLLPAAAAGQGALAGVPSLRQLADLHLAGEGRVDGTADLTADGQADPADDRRAAARAAARGRLLSIATLANRAGAMAEMEQAFLYDESRHLMTIGYNVDERRIDTGSYDLLASEARLGVYVAIAQGQLPQESWFALGRLLTSAAGEPVLLSWSGSMFEYLMPMLVMPSLENTLLDQTCQAAVQRQIEYGAQRGVPWGVSESGYNATDAALNYQYRAFGVPGLGLKRGLGEDLVVAPYASMMALMVAPEQACQNLQRLAGLGAAGRYGLYEAIDYTTSRLPRGQSKAVVRSFMAHHQGMGLLGLAHLLLQRPLQKHFEADPRLQATLLLLQERVPSVAVFQPHIDERAGRRPEVDVDEASIRVIQNPNTLTPEVQLLSNGRYHVMLTQAGGGYSRRTDMALTRWQEDTTRDASGSFCYLRDVASGQVWSTAHQPTRAKADHYEAIFSAGRAEFRRRDHGIDTHTEIVVSPEDDIELRRLRITNNSRTRRKIEVTSYAEVVLANATADVLHPAFSKLFVQTEILAKPAAVLCTRRPRSPQDATPWMFQLMAVHGVRVSGSRDAHVGKITHETDRARFIGRGNDAQSPLAMALAPTHAPAAAGPLSNTAGSVLDPVAASRCVITLEPDQTVIVDIVYGITDSRAACVALVEKYQDRRIADRVFELAWTHAQVVLRQLNASEADAQLYGRLASAVIYAHAGLRAEPDVMLRNRRGQSGLWGYGISGDLPIVLLQISSFTNLELVRQLVQAHAWWRLKGLAVDLVIWNEERDIYRQRLQEQILGLIGAGLAAQAIDRPGGIFVRHVDQIAQEDRVLLQSVARAVFSDSRGSLAEQINRRQARERRGAASAAPRAADWALDRTAERLSERSSDRSSDRNSDRRMPALLPSQPRHPDGPAARLPAARPPAALALHNGIGGFSADGREYVIAPPVGVRPPAPWCNVLANPRFGSVLSEAGSAYTWCENAHELRLTPWHNDPLSDGGGEVFYLRDEDSGEVWSPTSLPGPALGTSAEQHTTRHGFGYSVFEHTASGIRCELKVFVALDAAVKFSVLRIRNESGRPRRLTATGYVEWVLGDLRAKSAPHIVTELAPDGLALYARNPYSTDYGDWIGFFDAGQAQREGRSFTGDRAEFIGRNGSMRQPAALLRVGLSGRVGAGLDPCAAIQLPLYLLSGETSELVFRLGMGRSPDEANELVQRFRSNKAAEQVLDAVQQHWQSTLGAVQVRTPDPALDVLANGWLLYQTIACRMWARSGFYQSGGAFGFRDQLQDSMALVHASPAMFRQQLLLCASRQFAEGDVQHWWHPPQGRGVRTRISDDYLWLPLALARYVQTTGDTGLLDEAVPFLEGRAVNPHDESYYDMPAQSRESASLYEHAKRALLHGLRFGPHGLPLMGSGDWNDGMNLVGHGGQGESVWLGFFLCEVLSRFGELARRQGDEALATRCDSERGQLQTKLEQHGWDGAWYRRAYFDDGTPLGTAAGVECQIDSIAQSWSVLSGAAPAPRAPQAMDALHARLVLPDQRLVKLLDPPFDQKGPNPGYIAGYVPGVRENGGQYTHGAIWAAMAFAALGQRERAWSLLSLINPLHHTATPEGLARYKVEPYVMAADVYSVAPHTGRGGWTWYTGSAGWMYRLIVESLLGLRLETTATGACLVFTPCLPAAWPGYTLEYRYGSTPYAIELTQSDSADEPIGIEVDGVAQTHTALPLIDDGVQHHVRVHLRSGWRGDAAG